MKSARLKWPVVELGTPDFVRWADDPLPCSADPEAWHPGQGQQVDAEALCGPCPFVEPCLRYALADPKLSGVWGATSGGERIRLRREARAA